ncbi:MAG TPA: DUF359 domain-containing protein, partial [Methanocorpusculum sp.]|nr:DUF359 domain-containing protein [Methanocorpusculum sp.]
MLILPEKHRELLKTPFGTLYSNFVDVIPLLTGKIVCTVGDVVTNSALSNKIYPSIMIVDGFTKRLPYKSIPNIPVTYNFFKVKNSA